jgi:hypothetical protein
MIVIAIIWAICIPLSIICWGLSAGALGHYYSRIATGMNPLVLGLIAGSLAWALLVTLYSAIW